MYMSEQGFFFSKWPHNWRIILAKEQLGHSFIFWTMPVLIFCQFANFGNQSLVSRTFMAQSCVFLHENLRIVVTSFCRWQVSPVVCIYIWLPTKTLFSHNFTLDKPNLFFLHNLWVFPTKYSRRTVVYNMHILCYLCQNWIFYWISIPVISLLSQQDVL